MAVEAVDAHLGEAAILAVVFHAHTGLEAEAVSQRTRSHAVENLAGDHVDQRRTEPAHLLALGGGDHHLFQQERVGLNGEIQFQGLVGFDGKLRSQFLVSGVRYLDGVSAGGEVAEHVVALCVGEHRQVEVGNLHKTVRHVFARFVDYVSTDVSVGGALGLSHCYCSH